MPLVLPRPPFHSLKLQSHRHRHQQQIEQDHEHEVDDDGEEEEALREEQDDEEFFRARDFVLSVKTRFFAEADRTTYKAFLHVLHDFQLEQVHTVIQKPICLDCHLPPHHLLSPPQFEFGSGVLCRS